MFGATFTIRMMYDWHREMQRIYVLPNLTPAPKPTYTDHRPHKAAPINKPRPRCRT